MGLQNTDMAQAENAHVLVINQDCETDQLLVSLCRNGKKWLSPVGWTDQQKVTLLDCRSVAGTTEIDIPAEFARDIKPGDMLTLKCSELDLEKEIIWEESNIIPRADISKAVSGGIAGSLLSRFISSKDAGAEDTRSEVERRAEDAHRAAETYKAKMEAASAAKDDAQRKALEAARRAEEALKAEADRIAEMERAAKAFEEAERLEQDELRRVEEERLAEEMRLAEEARRIEAARKREERTRFEAERKAALERYITALDVTQNEEKRLKDRLGRLEADARDLSKRNAEQQAELVKSKEILAKKEGTVKTRRNSFEKVQSDLTLLSSDVSGLQFQTEALTTDKQALSMRLAQADADYIQAQKEAEEAIARADIKRSDLEIVRLEDSDMSARLGSLTEAFESQSRKVSDTAVKTQQLQSKFETAQAALMQTSLDVDAMERDQEALTEVDQTLRLEMEATQQAIEDTQARETAHQAAITHLEAGGRPDEVEDIAYDSPTLKTDLDAVSPEWEDSEKTSGRFFGRMRRNFKREADPEISIAVEDVADVKMEADSSENAPFPATIPQETTPQIDDITADVIEAEIEVESFFRRNSTSLIAIGAIIGGIAIIGGGYALNKATPQKLAVKSSMPTPTQVASAVTIIDPAMAPVIETPKVETISEAEKVAALELPVMAIPNLLPVGDSQATAKPAAKKTIAKKPVIQKPVVKTASIAAQSAPAKPARNYPELTKDVQTRLTALGFYTGPVNGLQTTETKTAIKEYKTIYDLAVDETISGVFLTSLKKTERLREEALTVPVAAPVITELVVETPAVQIAEAAPTIVLYDTLAAVPVTPVATDILPASSPNIAEAAPEVTPLYSLPIDAPPAIAEPEVTQVASAPVIAAPATAPVVENVIVEAKETKAARAKYPKAAERRDYYVDVAITVAYNIGVEGMVSDITILSNDHSGRFNEEFEKEAKRAVQRLRYSPQTVNGEPVAVTGKTKRIVFRAE